MKLYLNNVRQKMNLLLKNDTLSRRRPIPHPHDEKSSPLLIHEVCVRHWGGGSKRIRVGTTKSKMFNSTQKAIIVI